MAIAVPAAGKMLGRYQVLKPLAKGGMAEVFLARTIGLKGFERHVVLKFIRVDHEADAKTIDMLLDEARLVASLHHRNIVQVHDVSHEEGQYFFAMEYVHGEDARALLRKVKDKKALMPLPHILTIITAAAAGLHYAHEARGPDRKPLGIVHRDISPGNILCGFDGGVKVVDFGIAKTDAQSENTSAGEMKGKVGYMSPEQCKALPLDRRTDIYMLGIVLYELCTVRRLFKGENRFETMAQIVEGRIAPPSRYRKDLPDELEQIILKALAREPDDRYQTADDLRLVLEAFATRNNMQISPSKLSDYLKELFGERPEPWLVDEPPPDPVFIEPPSDRGRSSAPVIAPPAAEAVVAKPAESTSTGEPGTGSGDTPMAWPVDGGSVRRRRNVVVGVVGAGLLALGAVVFVMMSGGNDKAKAAPAAAATTHDAGVDKATTPVDAAVKTAETTPDAAEQTASGSGSGTEIDFDNVDAGVGGVADNPDTRPNTGRPGTGRPGTGRPGTGRPGTGRPGTGPVKDPDKKPPPGGEDLDSPFPTGG